jgi:hypothetical protein
VFEIDDGDDVPGVDAKIVRRPVGQVKRQPVHVLAEVERNLCRLIEMVEKSKKNYPNTKSSFTLNKN